MEMMETDKDYGVRVIRPFGQFSVGRIIFPPGTQRQTWLRSNMVEAVKAPNKVEDQKQKAAARREQ
jgi:hypothetical protein